MELIFYFIHNIVHVFYKHFYDSCSKCWQRAMHRDLTSRVTAFQDIRPSQLEFATLCTRHQSLAFYSFGKKEVLIFQKCNFIEKLPERMLPDYYINKLFKSTIKRYLIYISSKYAYLPLSFTILQTILCSKHLPWEALWHCIR